MLLLLYYDNLLLLKFEDDIYSVFVGPVLSSGRWRGHGDRLGHMWVLFLCISLSI